MSVEVGGPDDPRIVSNFVKKNGRIMTRYPMPTRLENNSAISMSPRMTPFALRLDGKRDPTILSPTATYSLSDTRGMVLLETISGKDEATAIRLIDAGANIHIKDDLGNDALNLACENGLSTVVDKLLTKPDINVNTQNNFYNTPLMYAVSIRGGTAVIKSLIAKGAEINTINMFRRTPLYIACNFKNKGAIKYLLDNGANPNIGKDPLSLDVMLGRDMKNSMEHIKAVKNKGPLAGGSSYHITRKGKKNRKSKSKKLSSRKRRVYT
jgi:hypothetical protein